MLTHSHGAIIEVGSTAALQPLPYFGVYAASKAFVQSFGDAIRDEHRRAGVRVVAVPLISNPVAAPVSRRP